VQYTPPLTLAGHTQHLGYWVIVRAFMLIFLSTITLVCLWQGSIKLAFTEIFFILLLMCGITLLSVHRLQQNRPVTPTEFFVQLLLDLIGLSLIFYYSGGANNPFISYFLVPICISAATLNKTHTLIITLLSLLSYSLLLFFHISLPILSPHSIHIEDMHHMNFFVNPHIFGMWLNFFISAGLISFFVVKMATDLRKQDAQLTLWREDQLRDEQVMAVATLAAGTAHELGTPLSTMKLLINEIRADYATLTPLQKDLNLLQTQIELCAKTLKELVIKAEQTKHGQIPPVDIRYYCRQIFEHWQILRPEAEFTYEINSDSPTRSSVFHPTITQAIINLLNNAADASPKDIRISISWNEKTMSWTIEDAGLGITQDLHEHLGKSFISTKSTGLGIGFMLTQATIHRYGGKVFFENRNPHGTITKLELPTIDQL
jgi:two-component system, sensor histidine kinase RegB